MAIAKLIPTDVGEYLHYDATTGNIRNNAGKRLGWITNKGYVGISWRRSMWLAHRIAWFLHTGEQIAPDMQIDHMNHNKVDNRACNLRLATNQQNALHRKDRVRDLPRGVTKHYSRYKACLGSFGGQTERQYIGMFDTPEDASRAYDAAFTHRYGNEWVATQ